MRVRKAHRSCGVGENLWQGGGSVPSFSGESAGIEQSLKAGVKVREDHTVRDTPGDDPGDSVCSRTSSATAGRGGRSVQISRA